MRYLLLTVLLLGTTWAIAQTDTNQGTSTQTTPTQASPAQTSPSVSSPSAGQSTPAQTGSEAGMSATDSGSQSSVEGCLSGSAGSYTLTSDTGTVYQLSGDTSKLSEHVGHEVKITGTSSTGGAGSAGETSGSGSASGSAGTAGDTMGHGNSSGQTLQVSSVEHVSKSCKGGGMSH